MNTGTKAFLVIGSIIVILLLVRPTWFDSITSKLFGPTTELPDDDHSKELDSLRKVVKMYQQDVSELNTTVTELNSQIEDLKYTIRRRENTIATLKKETNERINTVSKFTSSDIYKFLSDRYAKADTAKAR